MSSQIILPWCFVIAFVTNKLLRFLAVFLQVSFQRNLVGIFFITLSSLDYLILLIIRSFKSVLNNIINNVTDCDFSFSILIFIITCNVNVTMHLCHMPISCLFLTKDLKAESACSIPTSRFFFCSLPFFNCFLLSMIFYQLQECNFLQPP